jgi:hypothetical protein
MPGQIHECRARTRWPSIALLLALAGVAAPGAAQTPLLLESATLGATGLVGGTSITEAQFVGWRFEIDTTLQVEAIGGHLLGIPAVGNGQIFGAMIRLASIDVFPAGDPFTPEETLATVVFQPAFPSAELLVPLSVTLEPGAYALVFGSNLFGATGNGAIPHSTDQVDIPPTTIDSYIFYGIPGPGQAPIWRAPLASQMRFLVSGTTPATVPVLGPAGLGVLCVLIGLTLMRAARRRRGTRGRRKRGDRRPGARASRSRNGRVVCRPPCEAPAHGRKRSAGRTGAGRP